MTSLDRVLNLLEDYDRLADLIINNDIGRSIAPSILKALRQEKDQLTQELIEHGSRRKD